MLDLKIIDTNYKIDEIIYSQQDDSWDLLSFLEYADEQYLPDFIYANKYLENIDFLIEGNLEINIPKINAVLPSQLPPWKK